MFAHAMFVTIKKKHKRLCISGLVIQLIKAYRSDRKGPIKGNKDGTWNKWTGLKVKVSSYIYAQTEKEKRGSMIIIFKFSNDTDNIDGEEFLGINKEQWEIIGRVSAREILGKV